MRTKSFVVLCLAISSLAISVFSQTGNKPVKVNESYSALAVLPAGAGSRMAGPGANATVDIRIGSYSPDQDAQMLKDALFSGGQDEVVKKLSKMKSIGKVSLTGRVGFFDLKFIRSRPLDEGGRRIVAVSDRPIGFLEAYNAGRSMDYKIGILIMDLHDKSKEGDKKKKEEGEGSLIYAAKVKVIEAKTIEIENYGIEPVRLMGVRRL